MGGPPQEAARECDGRWVGGGCRWQLGLYAGRLTPTDRERIVCSIKKNLKLKPGNLKNTIEEGGRLHGPRRADGHHLQGHGRAVLRHDGRSKLLVVESQRRAAWLQRCAQAKTYSSPCCSCRNHCCWCKALEYCVSAKSATRCRPRGPGRRCFDAVDSRRFSFSTGYLYS